ncbi:High affinity cAMP-specific and IBMX-insensitive 3',5'-cyclic phosphodiesterase 9A [Mortierella sp. NVP85]|nr:High affinity cAMP-specific and IBMX-insensitive 3',5'-cyclic phosphodiesterase 9A [Mortierella sp. NVP85]
MRKFTADKVDPVGLDFSVWDYSIPEIYGIIVGMFVKLDLVECLNISESELLDFVVDVDRGYLQVFYHSFHHAADVTSVLYHMLLHMNASQYLSKPDMAALLLAGLCHDIGHPGLNNLYQVNAKSELAQQFGEASVLEKYSCSMAMDLVTKHRLFRNIAESPAATLPEGNRPTEESMRESMIKAIMATDMSFHYDMLSNLNALIEFTSIPLPSSLRSENGCCSHGHGSESESETDLDSMPPSPTDASCHQQRRFECPVARHAHRRQSSASSISSMCSEESTPVSYGRPTVRSPSDLTPELRQSLSNCLLHAADISNPVKPWGLCKRWSDLVVQEFFLQGDIEKSQSLPVSPNMDRDQHNQPQISLGFSDYVVQPYFESVVEFLPEAAPFLVTLASNREQWALLKEAMLAEKKAIAAAQASITITVAETSVAEEISDNGDVSTTVASTVATTVAEDVVVKPLKDDDNKLKPRVDTRPLHLSPSEKVREMASPSTPVFLIPDTRVSVAPGVVDLHDSRSQRQGHRRSRHTNNPDTVHHGGHHGIRKVKRSTSGKTLSASVRDSDVAQAQPPPRSHTGAIPTLNQEMVSQKKHEPAIVDGKDPLTNGVTEYHQHDQPPDDPKVEESFSEDERVLPPPIPVRVLTRASFFHNKFAGLPTPDASPRTELSPFIMETDPPNGPSGQGRMMARPRHGILQLESNHSNIRQEYGDGYVLLLDSPDGMDDHSVDNAKMPMDPLALPGVMNGPAEAALLSSFLPTGCKPPDEDDGALDFKTFAPSPSMSVSTAMTKLFTKNGGPPAVPMLDVLEDEVVDPKMRPIPSSLLASEDEGGPGIGCIIGTTATGQCDENLHHLDTDKTRAILASTLLMDGTISIATASAGATTT